MDTTVKSQSQDRFEAALQAAFDELAALRRGRGIRATSRTGGDASIEAALCDMILSIAATLGMERKKKYARQLAEVEHARVYRRSPLQETISETLDRERRPEWTIDEIREALSRQGVGAEAKAVANCIDYLIRTRRLKRIARGHYYDPEHGAGIITSDEVRTFDIPRGGENED